MRILIITIHNIHNFGSVFQAYALNKYLSECGYDTKIIDYSPKYFRRKKLKTLIGQLINLKDYMRRKHKYSKFIKNNMNLSDERYLSFQQLQKRPPKADLYIAGGDQLWNSYHDSGRDPAFKLLFSNGIKISYGTSMGRDNFTNEELLNLKNDLTSFKFVSVRELSSVNLLKSVGMDNVTQVADPVMLLNTSEYDNFISKPPIDKYMFIYLVQSSELLDKTIDYISKRLGLKVVLYAGLSKKCKCDYFLKDLGPDEVLSYIKNADFVLSASFHATLFSILYHKQFATLLPDKNTNDRIEDLLSWTNLKQRIIRDENYLNNQIIEDIDYYNTYDKIEKMIDVSKKYINNSITNACIGIQ